MGDPAITVTRFQLCVTTAINGAKRRAECAQTLSCGERITRDLTEQMTRAACGTTQETLDKINALLFISPNKDALWLLSDALTPMPFSFDGEIPSALVRALRQHASINPDRAVLVAISSALEVRHNAEQQKNVNVSDTTTGFMGQVIATIDDNFKKVADIGLLYRAKQFLEMLVETAAWPTLSRTALDVLARLQQYMTAKQIPPNPLPPIKPPVITAKKSDRAYALVAGGAAIAGAITVAVVRGLRPTPTAVGRARGRRVAFR